MKEKRGGVGSRGGEGERRTRDHLICPSSRIDQDEDQYEWNWEEHHRQHRSPDPRAFATRKLAEEPA